MTVDATPAGRSRKRTAPTAVPYVFLAPAVVLFTLVLLVPIGYTAYLSFRKVQVSGLGLGKGSRKEVFAGFDNYRAAFSDPELWSGALRVLGYGAILLPAMLLSALLFALLLDAPGTRFARFGRIAIFLPYAVPGVVASLLWGFLYLPAVSPLHYVLNKLGVDGPDLLGSGSVVGSLANIGVWGGVGFNMIVIYTSLRAIPRELFESARIDGCSEWQIAWRIKIPMVTPALIMTTVFSLIATLQVFTEPTTLAPMTNTLSSTWTPLMKIYRDAFVRNDLYSAAATSIVIAGLTLILSFGFLRVVQNRAFGSEEQ
ncbi:sugar ABC transporter permease [Luedemannella helvata]|uniref:Sugar ABC transporter permease n=1 Tax=Luedemannella helvata TaxID=349315 RepID=A0ABN2JY36_9ACTN